MTTFASREGAKFWFGIDLPKETAYLYKNIGDKNWVHVTYKEINAKKKSLQESYINFKLRSETLKPAYIWVFYNKTWLFGGWWIYIKTLKEDYPLNFRTGPHEKELVKKIMDLYPCNVLSFDFDLWAESFEKIYHHEGFKRTKQGLVKCYCRFNEYGYITDIIKI